MPDEPSTLRRTAHWMAATRRGRQYVAISVGFMGLLYALHFFVWRGTDPLTPLVALGGLAAGAIGASRDDRA